MIVARRRSLGVGVPLGLEAIRQLWIRLGSWLLPPSTKLPQRQWLGAWPRNRKEEITLMKTFGLATVLALLLAAPAVAATDDNISMETLLKDGW